MSKRKIVPTYEPRNYSRCPRCSKNIYHGFREAENVINHLQEENPDITLRVYKCPYNFGYHLTHRTDSAVNTDNGVLRKYLIEN